MIKEKASIKEGSLNTPKRPLTTISNLLTTYGSIVETFNACT